MECYWLHSHGGRVALGFSTLHGGTAMTGVMLLAIYLYAMWCLYVLVMGLYRAHMTRRLSGVCKILALPIVLLGYALDVAANWVVAPILFLDLPREALVSQRLIRYKREDHGWRGNVADLICEHLLDVFDPTGDHC